MTLHPAVQRIVDEVRYGSGNTGKSVVVLTEEEYLSCALRIQEALVGGEKKSGADGMVEKWLKDFGIKVSKESGWNGWLTPETVRQLKARVALTTPPPRLSDDDLDELVLNIRLNPDKWRGNTDGIYTEEELKCVAVATAVRAYYEPTNKEE